MNLETAAETICATGRALHSRGWVPATSGNFSMRLGDGSIAITVSGTNKGDLEASDVMAVNSDGRPLSDQKASAETGLHLQLYRRDPGIGAVLHTHSLNAVRVSMSLDRKCELSGLELLKAFDGISTHEAAISLPIYENTQDIDALAAQVEDAMRRDGQGHGYLIRGHGLYTWGRTMADCQRHLEALEYLLEYQLHQQGEPTR